MQIDRATVEKIAALAHLRLTEEEVTYYQEQLARVISFIEQIDSFENDLPEGWRADLNFAPSPERDDISYPSLAVEKVLQVAPRVVGTTFQVPRIIE